MLADYDRDLNNAMESNLAPTCDMSHDCAAPVTHIGSEGYAYCKTHAAQRKQYSRESVRPMTTSEMFALEAGKTVRYAREKKAFKSILDESK